MESIFQNSVSDFDLNFFEHTTNTSLATTSVPCTEARKLGIARLKDRLKGVSQVVHKAKKTNEILLEVQNKLLETKQELEETRSLLFDKNEEHKVICDERSVYFEQVSEYCKEIQNLKEKLAKYDQLNYDTQMKDKIINGYSEQVKGLQIELENLAGEKKQNAYDASITLRQVKMSKYHVEGNLVKILKHYVIPTTKKRSRWLESIIRQYVPEAIKDEDTEKKIDKKVHVMEKFEEPDLEDEPVQPLAQQYAVTDMDCVESVDTGRGSSLEFSDGEKSFHSPEYYMEDSPHGTVSNICKKCSISKSDASTSPMFQETSAIDNSANITSCKNCISLSRIDSCTSPILCQLRDAATETSFEMTTRDIVNHRITHKEDNTGIISCIQEIRSNDRLDPQCHIIKENTKKDKLLQDFTFDSDEEDWVADDGSRPVSPAEDCTQFSASLDDCDKSNQNKEILGETAPSVKVLINEKLDNCATHDEERIENFQEADNTHIRSQQETASIVKIQITAASDSEDDEAMEILNRSARQEDSLFTSKFDDEIINCSTFMNNKPLQTTLDRSEHQKTVSFELNNSKHCGDITEDDIEIQTILDKMRLHHQFITPLPRTPRRSVHSPEIPEENLNPILNSQVEIIANTINQQIDLLRSKVQEVFTPFVETLPQYLEQIPRLFSYGQQNEELLRNLMSNRDNNKTDKQSSSPEENWRNPRQPDVVDLNSGSMLTITNEDNSHGPDQLTIIEDGIAMEEDMDNLGQTVNLQTNILHNENENNKNSLDSLQNKKNNINLMKIEASHNKPCMNEVTLQQSESNKDCNYNKNVSESENEHTNVTISDEDINTNSIKSKKNIVYDEGTSDSDNDALELNETSQKLNNNSDQVPGKNKLKARKISKLDRFKIKMLPKAKIKPVFVETRKKFSKPVPITVPAPKKKVTESDTAATLNDKSVYENAVKVLAAQKIRKEPRVVIEDCVLISKNMPVSGDINKDDKNNNLATPPKKRKLSERIQSESNSPIKSVSNCQLSPFDVRKGMRKSTRISENNSKNTGELIRECSDANICDNILKKMKQKSPTTDKNVCKESSKNMKQEALLTKPDFDTSRPKRTQRAEQLSSPPDLKEVKRKRTCGVIESESPKRRSDNNVDPHSQRTLRSASTQNKDSEPSLVPHRRELRSNAQLDRSDNNDFLELLPMGRRKRISRIKIPQEPELALSPKGKMTQETERAISSRINTQQDLERPISSRSKAPQENERQISSRSKMPLETERQTSSRSKMPLETERTTSPRKNISQESEFAISPIKTPQKSEHKISKVKKNINFDSITAHDPSPLRTKEISVAQKLETPQVKNNRIVSYADLNILTEDNVTQELPQIEEDNVNSVGRKDSLLCRTIMKYGVNKLTFAAKSYPEAKIKEVTNKLEDSLSEIVEASHSECVRSMKKLVADIRKWDVKLFILGFIKFLRHPERKMELFNKVISPPAPPMTKKEGVLLYVLDELQKCYEYRNIVQKILTNIEYALFALNKTAEEFDVIEAMAHFYALLCRMYQNISRLRLFIVDAMYCLQLKSIILVQQCLEVWMLVLPLGHTGLAKCPLVISLVYLLHFFKCEDRYNRVRELRYTLRQKYNYDCADWSEPKILEHFKTAVTEIKENPVERKILRLSILILAKRNGAVWCHKNIVKDMLQPVIEDGKATDSAKRFAASLLGPLLKPYPANMKAHSETIVDYLLDMLAGKNSQKMQEAIISSLMCIDKNNCNNRLHRFLAGWAPKQVSPEFQLAFREYVRSKKINMWKNILSWQI